MTNSLRFTSPSTLVSGSRPLVRKDGAIRDGTKFLLDFTDPRCHPGGVITPGTAPGGTVFTDLVSGTPCVINGTSWTINADGSVTSPGSGGTGIGANYIAIGTAGQFALTVTDEFVSGVWFKLPSAGALTTNYMPLFTMTNTDANNSQVWFDLGIGGRRPRTQLGITGSAIGGGEPADIALNTPIFAGSRVQPGNPLSNSYFSNGAFVTKGNAGGGSVQPGNTALAKLHGNAAATFYRLFLTDVTVSLTSENALGRPLSQQLSGQQNISQENAYCRNLVAAAPRTTFS